LDGLYLDGNELSHFNSHNISVNNIVNGNPLYYHKDKSNIDIEQIPTGQLIIANCTDISVRNLEINKTDIGILSAYSNNLSFTGNNILNNSVGFKLYSSSNISVDGNNLKNNGYGFRLDYSNLNNFRKNNVTNNEEGFYIGQYSSYNVISENNISSNSEFGIRIYFSSASNNTIICNNIEANNDNGIYLFFTSYNRIICNNVSLNANYGIYLRWSSNNIIYHNNIVGNTNQSYDDSNNENQWDNSYPLGGNYWSDNLGFDNFSGPNQDIPGSDGIGDINYSIDNDSIDNYPLAKPFLCQPLKNLVFLKPGWNLISIPIIQEERNLTKVLGSIDSWYDAVQWYNQTDLRDHWKHYRPGKPFGNDLFHLNESMGFWIHITQPGDTIFLYNGTQPTSNQSITLHPGWNMVGYPSLSNRNRDNALNNINYGNDVDAVWTFNAATQTWQEIGSSDYFELGRGYWINSKVTKVWDVPL
jgi:parallel beta-helix repeat protein